MSTRLEFNKNVGTSRQKKKISSEVNIGLPLMSPTAFVTDSNLTLKSFADASKCCNDIEQNVTTLVEEPDSEQNGDTPEEYVEEYGEPMTEQHVTIDFTPQDSPIDSDYNMHKSIKLWEFLNQHPELHHLRVMPNVDFAGSTQSDLMSSTKSKLQDDSANEHAAVKWVLRRNFISPAFISKQPTTYCDDRAVESWEETPRSESGGEPKQVQISGITDTTPAPPAQATSSREVQRMMADMTVWDQKHPKSMYPPGHPPTLNSAKLVREGKFYWDQQSM